MSAKSETSPSASKRDDVILYACNVCAKQVYQEDIAEGFGCKSCGSRYVRPAPTTFYYVAGYLLTHPRMIPRYIREDVLGLS